jgi:CheY-like chemotaxis protein
VDLVILDLIMPQEDGASMFRRLRQHFPRLPVLLCTGVSPADPLPKSLAADAAGFLRKPFRMSELWYAVRQALSATVSG